MLKYLKSIIHLVKILGGYLTYHLPVKNLGIHPPRDIRPCQYAKL